MKEMQEKKYPFPDSDLSGMLNDLLKNGVIELPEPKRPEEAGRVIDPKYYRYHRAISHPLEEGITLKDRIMQLARDGKIMLDLDDTIETNHISTQPECSSSSWQQKYTRPQGRVDTELISCQGEKLTTIQFGSLESIVVLIKS